jgi:hypothetical protein
LSILKGVKTMEEKFDVTKSELFYPQPTKLQLKRQEIIKKWKDNILNLPEAANELANTGISIECAWMILQDT